MLLATLSFLGVILSSISLGWFAREWVYLRGNRTSPAIRALIDRDIAAQMAAVQVHYPSIGGAPGIGAEPGNPAPIGPGATTGGKPGGPAGA